VTTPTTPEQGPTPEGGVAFAAVLVVLALVFGLTGLAVAGDGDHELGPEGGSEGGSESGPVETVAIELGDFFVKPDSVEVPAGTRLAVDATNTGEAVHTLNLEGEDGTDRIKPGDSQTAELGVIDADTDAWCTIPGHREQGMEMTIVVTEESTTTEAPGGQT
jgi:nitrite reductase (NO-forming)